MTVAERRIDPRAQTGPVRQLDGLRAVAILVVLGYHSGVPGFDRGGFYGQDIFFVLSGFLITGLLLAEHDRMGKVGLAAFWSRRARRLLPALALMLIATAAYVRFVVPPGRYLTFKGEALATAFYGSNWWLIGEGSNCFASAGARLGAGPSAGQRAGGPHRVTSPTACTCGSCPCSRSSTIRQQDCQVWLSSPSGWGRSGRSPRPAVTSSRSPSNGPGCCGSNGRAARRRDRWFSAPAP